MALTALTATQQQTVAALVTGRRIDVVPADALRAAAFLVAAADRMSQLPLLTSSSVRYDIAYDAAHDVGEALLAAYGCRTRSGPGQHEALGRFLRAVLDNPPGDTAARQFEQLRRARNRNRYEAVPISAADAALAVQVANELRQAAITRGAGT